MASGPSPYLVGGSVAGLLGVLVAGLVVTLRVRRRRSRAAGG